MYMFIGVSPAHNALTTGMCQAEHYSDQCRPAIKKMLVDALLRSLLSRFRYVNHGCWPPNLASRPTPDVRLRNLCVHTSKCTHAFLVSRLSAAWQAANIALNALSDVTAVMCGICLSDSKRGISDGIHRQLIRLCLFFAASRAALGGPYEGHNATSASSTTSEPYPFVGTFGCASQKVGKVKIEDSSGGAHFSEYVWDLTLGYACEALVEDSKGYYNHKLMVDSFYYPDGAFLVLQTSQYEV
ncbi:hypothetical protein FOZ61_007440 [Perkinsus olseni]|uniref:Uncharacterized protein n=1 Tax=Perkinsus olseni TaxID=32597 RepID=A0A7J6LN00_PEROL|nr:hypothetical protein FOZ61_007440 [Perkinsus olseni]KAF4660573.1 hypothetical protein FOL46_006084 [Perkinsus olseni]